jgi:hypothetical protein
MENKIKNIFLIDDEFPPTKEFISKGIYEKAISANDLYCLALNEDWGSLHDLQNLIKNIVTSKAYEQGLINLSGYSNPELAFADIEIGVQPDVLVYDWEYGMPNAIESQNWLLEILSKTDAFVFVYSKVRDQLPAFLNKDTFDEHASRFQLFLKGNQNMSLFSSEEFILQYVLSLVSSEHEILVQGERVQFRSNGFLKDAKDILYLDKIFGRQKLVELIKGNGNIISDETLSEILSGTSETIRFDEVNKLLITSDSSMMIKKYQPATTLTYLEVATKYGLIALADVLEIGITKVGNGNNN